MSPEVRALAQLIALRRQTLEDLRKDMATLNLLVSECEENLNQTRAAHSEFVEELRAVETGVLPIFAVQMMEHRRYMAHLQQQIERADITLREALEQQRHAQNAFNECFTEIRTLERVVERRMLALNQERQRKDYLIADDQEILRLGKNWSMYGAN